MQPRRVAKVYARFGVFILKVFMTRLILIRHGQTDYNLKNRYCGFTDISINDIGKIRARKIKKKLKGLKIDKIFCSDLKRSWQTAKIIFNHKKCFITKTPNLREIDFGIWDGLNFKQVIKEQPLIYKKWLKNPFSVDIPDGEKMSSFVNRIKKELKSIVKDNTQKTVAMVGHAGPLRVILNAALGIKRKDFWKAEIKPQTIYIIKYNNLLKTKVYKL